MIIALTGTPGTGKTSMTEHLSDEYSVIDLTEFVKKRGLGEEGEKEFEADVQKMIAALKDEIDGDTVIEGHLSHHFPADYCVVLRCRPDILRERLSERNYSEEKIEENVESEALDIVLQEAIQKQEKIIEIDTTDREPSNVAGEIEKRVKEDDAGYGNIDYSEFL